MSRSSNTIKASDISTTPILLKYSASYSGNANSGMRSIIGVNNSISSDTYTEESTLNYRVLRQLYYQNYITGTLLQTASYWDSNQQSTANSLSTEFEDRTFPTETNAAVLAFTIPPNKFGEQISKGTFKLNTYNTTVNTPRQYYDDGNGNLRHANISRNLGNIIYSQGIAIITDPNEIYYSTQSDTNYVIFVIYNNTNRIIGNILLENDTNLFRKNINLGPGKITIIQLPASWADGSTASVVELSYVSIDPTIGDPDSFLYVKDSVGVIEQQFFGYDLDVFGFYGAFEFNTNNTIAIELSY